MSHEAVLQCACAPDSQVQLPSQVVVLLIPHIISVKFSMNCMAGKVIDVSLSTDRNLRQKKLKNA
jgi:hypothetical protein